MCLFQVTRRLDNEEGIGYKVVFRYPNSSTVVQSQRGHYLYTGVWLASSKVEIIHQLNEWYDISYDSGFHIFESYEDARLLKNFFSASATDVKIVKVAYRKARLFGIQQIKQRKIVAGWRTDEMEVLANVPCIIADSMQIFI